MRTLGTSTHTDHDRQVDDYYATHPIAAKLLLELEPQLQSIWECACGAGHLAKVIDENHKLLRATDLVDRGYGNVFDFFDEDYYAGDIVTNPPFKDAQKFIEHALNIIDTGHYACFFLKLQFLEGKARREFYEKNPPKRIWVASGRIPCAMDGQFEVWDAKKKKNVPISSPVCYAWFIWEKGFKGKTTLGWMN